MIASKAQSSPTINHGQCQAKSQLSPINIKQYDDNYDDDNNDDYERDHSQDHDQ